MHTFLTNHNRRWLQLKYVYQIFLSIGQNGWNAEAISFRWGWRPWWCCGCAGANGLRGHRTNRRDSWRICGWWHWQNLRRNSTKIGSCNAGRQSGSSTGSIAQVMAEIRRHRIGNWMSCSIVGWRNTARWVLLKILALALRLRRIAAAHTGAIVLRLQRGVSAAVQLPFAAGLTRLAETLSERIVIDLQFGDAIVLQAWEQIYKLI